VETGSAAVVVAEATAGVVAAEEGAVRTAMGAGRRRPLDAIVVVAEEAATEAEEAATEAGDEETMAIAEAEARSRITSGTATGTRNT
jgi:hypothetical protein